mmetsp:Transcript_8480/g.16019  ORF Transcript_8480/g.16019 Transcript_8480/m.16019 type:complete len:205 (-) Transcript_8480:430-1044(-)
MTSSSFGVSVPEDLGRFQHEIRNFVDTHKIDEDGNVSENRKIATSPRSIELKPFIFTGRPWIAILPGRRELREMHYDKFHEWQDFCGVDGSRAEDEEKELAFTPLSLANVLLPTINQVISYIDAIKQFFLQSERKIKDYIDSSVRKAEERASKAEECASKAQERASILEEKLAALEARLVAMEAVPIREISTGGRPTPGCGLFG